MREAVTDRLPRTRMVPEASVPRRLSRVPWAVLAAVSAGGVLGSLARYALTLAIPRSPRGFPWATFTVNVSGALLIGLLMALLTSTWRAHRLVRPFLGIGVLGGFTTFSSYIVDIQRMLAADGHVIAFAYLAGTPVTALLAAAAGVRLVRPRRRRPRAHHPDPVEV